MSCFNLSDMIVNFIYLTTQTIAQHEDGILGSCDGHLLLLLPLHYFSEIVIAGLLSVSEKGK